MDEKEEAPTSTLDTSYKPAAYLSQIDKPFGELDPATRVALFEAHQYGFEIEVRDLSKKFWWAVNKPWFMNPSVYRVKPEPLVPDYIDWDHVSPTFNYMARDFTGTAWIYAEKPEHDEGYWYWTGTTIAESVRMFASYRQGTVKWQDSLVERPAKRT